MNERVWLQPETLLVNKFLAIFAGLLVFSSLPGCSRNDGESQANRSQISKASSNAVTKTDNSPGVTAIWGTDEFNEEVRQLALGRNVDGVSYVLAILSSGEALLMDLDGAVTAQGQLPTTASLANGFDVEIDGEALLAFPTLNWSPDGGAPKLTLASPTLGVMTQVDLVVDKDIVGFCPHAHSSSQVIYSAKGKETNGGNVVLENDIVHLVAFNNTRPAPHWFTANPVCDSEIEFEIAGHSITAALNEDFQLQVRSLQSTGGETEQLVHIRPGLSVSAPDRITGMAILEGKISVDYPNGLIAVAGPNPSGEHRVSFLSARDIAHLLGLTITPPAWSEPSAPTGMSD